MHVGSTAVPGLAAKPVIDILVSVPDVDDEQSYLTSLKSVLVKEPPAPPGVLALSDKP